MSFMDLESDNMHKALNLVSIQAFYGVRIRQYAESFVSSLNATIYGSF